MTGAVAMAGSATDALRLPPWLRHNPAMVAEPDPTLQLLEEWHRGDERSLARLVEQHLPWLREQVDRRLGPALRQQGEVEDYLQDAMLDFLRDAPRFVVRDGTQFRALLGRVLENTLRDRNDWFRAKRRDLARKAPLPTESVLSLDPALQRSTTPSRDATRNEVRDWVRLALELLEAEDRKIILLREYEGRSFVEIGTELGMTANAVRMRWVRAVARLAEVMKELRGGTVPPATEP
jgi:RNA polymerase sigma-70 factor (ECF subfamily)